MLDSLKAIQESDISAKIIKVNSDLFAKKISKSFNESLEKSKLPDCLKLANVTPVFKKGPRTSKTNYRPINILPILSQIFERLISKQLLEFFESLLSKFQCSFRKGYGPQSRLLMMLETFKDAADNNKSFWSIINEPIESF